MWLLNRGVIDGPGGLGRLTKEFHSRADDGYNSRNLSFENFLKQRHPEDWVAYRTYKRLINKE